MINRLFILIIYSRCPVYLSVYLSVYLLVSTSVGVQCIVVYVCVFINNSGRNKEIISLVRRTSVTSNLLVRHSHHLSNK